MAFPRLLSLPRVVIGPAFLAGYVLLDWASYIQPFGVFGITPWNPPTGLSFVLILIFGQRFLPLIFRRAAARGHHREAACPCRSTSSCSPASSSVAGTDWRASACFDPR